MDGRSSDASAWLSLLARFRRQVSLLPSWWSQVLFPGPGARSSTRARVDSSARTFGPLLLLLLAAGLLYFGRFRVPLLEPEDSHYAEIARQMAEADSWVVPVYRGRPFFEKPPLFFWLLRLAYAGFGVHDWAARLVPCLAGVGTILVTFWWGKKVGGLRTGVAAAFILCLSPRFLHQTRLIIMDGLLGLWIVSALALGQQAIQTGRLQWRYWLLSAAACALGVLTKGPVTLVLVAVPLLAYQVLDPRTARPRGWGWPAYLAAVLGLVAPWFVAIAWRHPEFLREYFWMHHVVMRYVQPIHPKPAWFFLPIVLLGMMPWTLLVPSLIQLLVRRSRPGRRRRIPELGFWLLCSLWCLAFYSAADCKRIGYILPAMPPLALALGYTLDRRLLGMVSPERQRREEAPRVAFSFRDACGTRLALPYWATMGVLTGGLAAAIVAAVASLVTPIQGGVMAMLATAGIGCWAYRGPRQTPAGCWIGCGVATFGILLLAVHLVLPNYYRKFSIRAQVWSTRDASDRADVPVVCYPRSWDSVHFYLAGRAIEAYGPGECDRLIARLQSGAETLVFVKTGAALDDLRGRLPAAVELETISRGEIVFVGVARREVQSKGARVFGDAPPFQGLIPLSGFFPVRWPGLACSRLSG